MDVYLPTDRETGRPRGFAFVQFSTEEEAAAAIRLFNERELSGRRLKVNAAEDRPPRGDGPRPPRFAGPLPPPPPPLEGDFGAPRGARPFRAKGSRRGLRRRKRSL